MSEADNNRDAESIFIPQLLLDLIQKLVECHILRTEDASELISNSLSKSAECNPAFAKAILDLSEFCGRYALPRRDGGHGLGCSRQEGGRKRTPISFRILVPLSSDDSPNNVASEGRSPLQLAHTKGRPS